MTERKTAEQSLGERVGWLAARASLLCGLAVLASSYGCAGNSRSRRAGETSPRGAAALENAFRVRLSLDVRDAALERILSYVSRESGLSFVIPETLEDRRLTLKLRSASVRELLESISAREGVGWRASSDAPFVIRFIDKNERRP